MKRLSFTFLYSRNWFIRLTTVAMMLLLTSIFVSTNTAQAAWWPFDDAQNSDDPWQRSLPYGLELGKEWKYTLGDEGDSCDLSYAGIYGLVVSSSNNNKSQATGTIRFNIPIRSFSVDYSSRGSAILEAYNNDTLVDRQVGKPNSASNLNTANLTRLAVNSSANITRINISTTWQEEQYCEITRTSGLRTHLIIDNLRTEENIPLQRGEYFGTKREFTRKTSSSIRVPHFDRLLHTSSIQISLYDFGFQHNSPQYSVKLTRVGTGQSVTLYQGAAKFIRASYEGNPAVLSFSDTGSVTAPRTGEFDYKTLYRPDDSFSQLFSNSNPTDEWRIEVLNFPFRPPPTTKQRLLVVGV
jgi:hypothetical protein